MPVREWSARSAGGRPERRLRGWVRQVYQAATAARPISGRGLPAGKTERGLKVAALLTDGFGARGGIAQYSRDLLEALCRRRDVAGVTALPRHAPDPLGSLPPLLTYRTDGLGGKTGYLKALLTHRRELSAADLIVCGHINLLPAAWALKRRSGAPLVLFVYGVDAWQPVGGWPVRHALASADAVVSISRITLDRFLSWAPVAPDRGAILPNAIHLDRYGTGPKDVRLLRRYGLEGKRVLLTLGRIVSRERGKGFDEVINVLPGLLADFPDIAYLVVGEGDGLPRLKRLAARLGLGDRVVFAGYVPELEKTAHYRLADAYVMPSRGEGFGFVFLEAMACGIPVVASASDGSREAVRDGDLGLLVDPDSQEQIAAAVAKALTMSRNVPAGLSYFSAQAFSDRLNAILDRTVYGPKERAA